MLEEVGKSQSTVQNDEITDGKSCKRQLVHWSLKPSASWARLSSQEWIQYYVTHWNTSILESNMMFPKWIVCRLTMIAPF